MKACLVLQHLEDRFWKGSLEKCEKLVCKQNEAAPIKRNTQTLTWWIGLQTCWQGSSGKVSEESTKPFLKEPVTRPLEEKAVAFKIPWPFDFSFPVEWPSMWFCNLFNPLNSHCLFYFNLPCYYCSEQTFSVQWDQRKLPVYSLGSHPVGAARPLELDKLSPGEGFLDPLLGLRSGQWL